MQQGSFGKKKSTKSRNRHYHGIGLILILTILSQNYPEEILLKSGKYVVDAKSILGIFSLDLSQPLTVEVYADNCDELLEKLKEFKA